MSSVVVFNPGGVEAVHFVSPKHARKMLYRNVARVVSILEDGKLAALELLRYIFPKWKYDTKTKHYSKRGVLERDNHICAYCGSLAKTIDHVTPKCQGGTSVWKNTVASCEKCNIRKGGRTPEEAGMKLKFMPYIP